MLGTPSPAPGSTCHAQLRTRLAQALFHKARRQLEARNGLSTVVKHMQLAYETALAGNDPADYDGDVSMAASDEAVELRRQKFAAAVAFSIGRLCVHWWLGSTPTPTSRGTSAGC